MTGPAVPVPPVEDGPKRDVQLSAFPEIQADKPVGAIIGSVFTGTNADLMKAVAPLYLTGSVLDVTYGEGKWWDRFRPEPFTFHDLHKVDGVSFLDLPEADSSVDTVCFDPPYIPAGGYATSTTDDFRDRFGLTPMGNAELIELVQGGIRECTRVARRYVIAKCTDFVSGGKFRLGHLVMIEEAAAAGWTVHDLIVHHTGAGPGGNKTFTVLRARRHHSYLLVFAAPR